MPTLKLKVIPKFPSDVIGGNGITITKLSGRYTIAINTSDLAGLLDADLTAIAALSGTGVLRRTGTNVWGLTAFGAQGTVLTSDGVTTPSFIGGEANAKAFGAVGNGVANDTTFVQTLINDTAFRTKYFPAGTYMLDHIDVISGIKLKGDGAGKTIFKCRTPPAAGTDWFYALNRTDVEIEGITFNGNGNLTDVAGGHIGSLLPCIYFEGGSRIHIHDCEFIGWSTAGLLTNTAFDIQVRNNIITRSVAAVTVNHAIVMVGTGTLDANNLRNFVIDGNRCTNGNISLSGHDGAITNNTITGWGFSAGINTQPLDSNFALYIAGNKCFNSNQAVDSPGGYFPAGIENWAPRSTIVGNICYGNWGSGIDCGAADCAIIGNDCYNNGAGGADTSGIVLHAQDATWKADRCIIAGNRCFDTRVGGAKTQAYGYYEHSKLALNSATGIVVGHNHFEGNLTGRMLLQTLAGSAPKRASSMAADIIMDPIGGISGGYIQFVNSLSLANNGFHFFISPGTANFTADRTFTVELNNSSRILNLAGGNVTFGGPFVTTGGSTLTLNTSGVTNITLPAVTDTAVTLAAAQALINKTYNGNTWTAGTGALTIGAGKTGTFSNTLTFAGTDGSTLNIGTGGTLGTAAFQNTGTSGATIPLLNGSGIVTSNSWAFGAGSGGIVNAINGGNSGAGGGAALFCQNAGALSIAMGNLSVITGGAYDATGVVYSGGAVIDIYPGGVRSSRFHSSGGVSVGGTTDPGSGAISATAAITSALAVAPPASGATTCGIKISSTANLGWFAGTGAPTFSAAKGSIYSNTTATTTTTRFYINTDGGTTWTNFTTAA